jgi:surface antigen
MFRKIAVIAVVVTGLAACESSGGQKQTGGALLGGIGGAVVGSQFGGGTGKLAAVAAGTLLGALIGSEIGSSLDKADKAAMSQSTQNALETRPSGSSTTWWNPDSGNYGTITPERTYNTSDGTPCREFTQTIYVGGKAEQAYGTACRQQDGSWKIQS